jgi:hypothetical protein
MRGCRSPRPVVRHNLDRADTIEDSTVARVHSGAMLRRALPVPVGARHRLCPLECYRRDLERSRVTARGSTRIAFSTRKCGRSPRPRSL